MRYAIGTSFFKYMVYNDPGWDYRLSTVDQNMRLSDGKLARTLNATDPNLKQFRAGGGKLILYHGWADSAIPPQSTVNYYESIVGRMGPKASTSFVRLFTVPVLLSGRVPSIQALQPAGSARRRAMASLPGSI